VNSTGFEDGWIKLWRITLDKTLWQLKPEFRCVAIACLLMANHQEGKWYCEKTGETVNIPIGSFVTTIRNLAERANISVQSTRTALTHLENISFLVQKSTQWFTLITICNWDIYQHNEKEANTKLTQSQHKGNTEQECKECKEVSTIAEETKKTTVSSAPSLGGNNKLPGLYYKVFETYPKLKPPTDNFLEQLRENYPDYFMKQLMKFATWALSKPEIMNKRKYSAKTIGTFFNDIPLPDDVCPKCGGEVILRRSVPVKDTGDKEVRYFNIRKCAGCGYDHRIETTGEGRHT